MEEQMAHCKMLRVFAMVGLVFFVSISTVKAQETKPHTFTLTPQISYITYEEPDIMEETGIFYGLFGSYTFRAPVNTDGNFMFKTEARVSTGQVDYDGQLSDGTPYKINDIDDFLGELRGVAGFDVSLLSSTTLTPFAGIGYRFLSDNLSKDPAGYRRFSNYVYSPIGVETKTPFGDGWTAGVTLEYDLFWFGKQYSNLSDFNSAYSDVTNDQEGGYGLRASVKITKVIENMNLLIEPYGVYWSIDRSKDSAVSISGSVAGTAYEPKNNSTEIGARVGVEF